MRSIFQLQHLPLPQRAQYIMDYGTFVESRTEGDFSSNLYRIDNYYAEVVYDNEAKQIEDIVLKEAFIQN